MLEFEDGQSDRDELTHSLDSEYGGLEIPTLRTPTTKKVLTTSSEKVHRSTREKNVVNRFGYNDYMAYQYAFIIKVAIDQVPESFPEAAMG